MSIKIYKTLTQKYHCFKNIISKFDPVGYITGHMTRTSKLVLLHARQLQDLLRDTLLHLNSTFNVSDDLYDMGIAKYIIEVNESRDQLLYSPVGTTSFPGSEGLGLSLNTVSIWQPDNFLTLCASQDNLCQEEAGGFLSLLFLNKTAGTSAH